MQANTSKTNIKSTITNLLPKDSINLAITIPTQQSTATVQYPKGHVFENNDFNILSGIRGIVEIGGIYNIKQTEIVTLSSVPITINPGFYNVTAIEAILPGITILGPGENSSHSSTGTQTIIFNPESIIAVILGFSLNTPTTVLSFSPGTISPYITNFAVGYQTLNIKCNFNAIANTFGNNYIANIILAPNAREGFNQLVPFNYSVLKPITIQNINVLTIDIYDANDRPYVLQSPLTLFFDIDIYDKLT